MSFEPVLPSLRPIKPLLLKESISEIIGNRDAPWWYERSGVLCRETSTSCDASPLPACLEEIANQLGEKLDEDSPFLHAHAPDGSRLAAAVPPVVRPASALTLRRILNPDCTCPVAQVLFAIPSSSSPRTSVALMRSSMSICTSRREPFQEPRDRVSMASRRRAITEFASASCLCCGASRERSPFVLVGRWRTPKGSSRSVHFQMRISSMNSKLVRSHASSLLRRHITPTPNQRTTVGVPILRHITALLSGLLSQSKFGPLLQNARLGLGSRAPRSGFANG
jgi:hypothetical protein